MKLLRKLRDWVREHLGDEPHPAPPMATPLPSEQDLTGAFAVLLEDSFRRTDRVEEQLRQAELRYTSRIEDRSYRTFIQALGVANHGTRELLRQREDRFNVALQAPEQARGHLAASVYETLGGHAHNIGDHLERHLPELFVDRADELGIFAVPFTRMAKAIIPNVELLFLSWYFDGFRAQLYDVHTAGDDLLRENLRRAFGRDVKFVKLWHPATRQQDVFQHAVFAHELGHIAVGLRATPEAVASTEGASPDQDWTYSTLAHGPVSFPSGLTSEEEDQLVRWFVELACDVFAMRTIGPAFVIGFTEVTAHNRTLEPEESAHESHPPAHLRVEVLRRETARFSFGPHQEAVGTLLAQYLDSYPQDVEADDTIPGSRDFLLTAVERFAANIGNLLGPQEYKETLLKVDAPLVFEAAAMRVPPAERLVCVEDPPPGDPAVHEEEWSRAVDWRSILNGLLFWHLTEVAFPSPQRTRDDARKRADHRRLATQLCVGAIELSEFHGRASYLREQLKAMSLRRAVEVGP